MHNTSVTCYRLKKYCSVGQCFKCTSYKLKCLNLSLSEAVKALKQLTVRNILDHSFFSSTKLFAFFCIGDKQVEVKSALSRQ